jgi:DNA-binding CsgD family transcriptional regulator
VFHVPPWALPPAWASPSEAGEAEAVCLLLERARGVGFDVADGEMTTIVEVCRRLDGIPLAIELAAARLRLLSVDQLAARLDDSLALLTRRGGAAVRRHRTLRATVDWSYDLLTLGERRLFARLSAFAGGWSLEAAEAVCAEGIDHHVLDMLDGLVAKSLVVAEAGRGRFRLLGTIRQYAAAKLTSDESTALGDRHLSWCLALVERAEAGFAGPEHDRWIAQLEEEHDNLRAALRWSVDARRTTDGLQLAAAMWWFWYVHGHASEGRRWLSALLAAVEHAPPPAAVLARGLMAAAHLAVFHADTAAARLLAEESLELWRRLGDRRGEAAVLHTLAHAVGEHAAERSLLEESVAIAREAGDSWTLAWTLHCLGNAALGEGDAVGAQAHHEECVALFARMGHRWGTALGFFGLGNIALHRGDYAAARAFYEQNLVLRREIGHRSLSDTFNALGQAVLGLGDLAGAGVWFREALASADKLGNRWEAAIGYVGLARVMAGEAYFLEATRLLSVAAAIHEAAGAPLPPVEQNTFERAVAAVRARLPRRAFVAAWDAGRALEEREALAAALAVQAAGSTSRRADLSRPADGWPLSSREYEVARAIARGLTNGEIAAALTISRRTVERHVENTFAKLGVTSRAQIATWTTRTSVFP